MPPRAGVARGPAGVGRAGAAGQQAATRATRRRRARSGATTPAGAAPARSTRSATAADGRRRSGPPPRHRRARVVYELPSLAGLVGAFIVAGYTTWRIWDQGGRDEAGAADAIVVLGAAQYDGIPSPIFEARLAHAVDLYRGGPRAGPRRDRRQAAGDRTTEAATARDTRSRTASRTPRSSSRTRAGRPSNRSEAVPTCSSDRRLASAVFVRDRTHICECCEIARARGSSPTAHRRRRAPAMQPRPGRLRADDPRARRRSRVLLARRHRPSPRRSRQPVVSRHAVNRRDLIAPGNRWPGNPFARPEDPHLYSAATPRGPGTSTFAPAAPPRPDHRAHRRREGLVKQAEEAASST